MPRIVAATVAENRQQRRSALIDAAGAFIVAERPFTVADVAEQVGLSRSSVYEYYRGTSDLVADVVIAELHAWCARTAPSATGTPRQRVAAWVDSVLWHVADGRHALLAAASRIDVAPERREEIRALHESLVAPLVDALTDAGAADPRVLATYVWAVVEVAVRRIESGAGDAGTEATRVAAFVDAGLGLTA